MLTSIGDLTAAYRRPVWRTKPQGKRVALGYFLGRLGVPFPETCVFFRLIIVE
jgi:hypothetical protein